MLGRASQRAVFTATLIFLTFHPQASLGTPPPSERMVWSSSFLSQAAWCCCSWVSSVCSSAAVVTTNHSNPLTLKAEVSVRDFGLCLSSQIFPLRSAERTRSFTLTPQSRILRECRERQNLISWLKPRSLGSQKNSPLRRSGLFCRSVKKIWH